MCRSEKFVRVALIPACISLIVESTPALKKGHLGKHEQHKNVQRLWKDCDEKAAGNKVTPRRLDYDV